MPTQLTINFDVVHKRENNPVSEAHLNLRRDDFDVDCWNVLQALLNGERLTVLEAHTSGLSGHLPRRICDLRSAPFHIDIKMQWIYTTGENGKKKKAYGEYYIEEPERIRVMKRIINKLN